MKAHLDPEKLTGPQKAAVLLISMGEDYASKVFTKMSDREIREIAAEMSRIDRITPEVLAKVSEEFGGRFERETAVMVQGASFLKNVMERALEAKRAAAIAREVENRNREKPFVWCRKIDPAILANYIEEEHPQTAAMILAHLPAETASDVISNMSEEKKAELALRIAEIDRIPDEIVRAVDDTLKKELGSMGTTGGKADSVQVLVDILGGVDKNTEDTILEVIEEEQAEMAGDIRSRMFVFEDLVRVDNKGMQEILKNIDSNLLPMALKSAGKEMREKVFSNMSLRAAEALKEDLEIMGPTRLTDVKAAQQKIVAAAKELEAQGIIVLGGKGKDDILV